MIKNANSAIGKVTAITDYLGWCAQIELQSSMPSPHFARDYQMGTLFAFRRESFIGRLPIAGETVLVQVSTAGWNVVTNDS